MKLSKLEKETIIIFNEADGIARVDTFNTRVKKSLLDYKRKFPDLYKHICDTKEGSTSYEIPKESVRIVQKRKVSSERKKQLKKNLNSGDKRN